MSLLSALASPTFKRSYVWVLVLLSVLGVVIGYGGIYIMAAYFASGLVWWATYALMFSSPLGGTSAIVAWSSPRQRIAATIGLLVFAAWLFLWAVIWIVAIRSWAT
jgi:hypothetical protein